MKREIVIKIAMVDARCSVANVPEKIIHLDAKQRSKF